MPTATPVPRCPEPTEGTQLLTNERYGYCLLVPTGYLQSGPLHQVAIAPEGFVFWETPGPVGIGVSDAAGLSASQWLDLQVARESGFVPERASVIIGGEEAILLPEIHGQASTREVIIVHEDRRYTVSFLLPDPADAPAVEQMQRLYDTIINSFTFVPVVPSSSPPEPGQAGEGSAVIAYIKDGNLLVWEQATGKSQTVYDSGDVIRVELSDDGQLVAFVRRTLLGQNPRYGRSSLWVVERGGGNPRELVSDSQLRARLGATDDDDIDFPALEWIPNGHRLLYSITFFPAYLWEQGLYLVDADTLASAELAPVNETVDFLPSPDGEHIAIFFSSGPAFAEVDNALSGNLTLTRPTGVTPALYCGRDCASFGNSWTQDSSALIVIGSRVYDRTLGPGFTIWRVPINGSPAEPLVSYRGERAQLASDGSVAAFIRWTAPFGKSRRFVVPLPENLGPLAIRTDPLGLSWLPGDTAYVLGDEEMSPLCPNAAQAIEVCGPSIAFGEPVRWLEWLDRERFLYLTYVPSRLNLGSLDGSTTLIAEDPHAPPNASVLALDLSFAAVASTCVDDSEFISDVTVPDGTRLAPNTFFVKTWRLRNTGTCIWDDSYRFTYLSGDRLSGPRSAPLDEPVEPGEEVEVSVGLIAPEAAGTYQGQWQMFAPDGTPFGNSVYVAIVVP
jgi:hypothetical protein